MKPISNILKINSDNEIVARHSRRGIKESEIENEVMVCPYCMNDVDSDQRFCCGESSAHFQMAYVVDGEAILDSECVVLEDQ